MRSSRPSRVIGRRSYDDDEREEAYDEDEREEGFLGKWLTDSGSYLAERPAAAPLSTASVRRRPTPPRGTISPAKRIRPPRAAPFGPKRFATC
jgi:hypothetical protein